MSYSFQLGAAYAELYPENVGTMVLDSVVNQAQASMDTLFTKTTAYENVLNRFSH